MKKLAFILCLIASPVLADDPKPPVWLLAMEFKSGIISANYASQDACKAAAKAAGVYAKAAAKFHCFPVLAQ